MKPKFHLVRCLFLALGVSASFGLGPGADTWNINVDESQGASADIYFFGQCTNGATGVGKLFNGTLQLEQDSFTSTSGVYNGEFKLTDPDPSLSSWPTAPVTLTAKAFQGGTEVASASFQF